MSQRPNVKENTTILSAENFWSPLFMSTLGSEQQFFQVPTFITIAQFFTRRRGPVKQPEQDVRFIATKFFVPRHNLVEELSAPSRIYS